MKIIRNEELATWTLVPVEEGEAETLASVVAMLKPEDRFGYGGMRHGGEDGKSCLVYLHVGAERREKKEIVSEHLTFITHPYEGGIELVLGGSTEEDKKEMWGIRYGCCYGGGLIFLGETEIDGKKAIITTAGCCKHCGAALLEPEWKTCDTCAAKCEHDYVKGAVHGGGMDIGVGEFCDKCGRSKPRSDGEREKTVIENHLEVEKELGIPVFHKVGDIPFVSSQEIVKVNRLARRYAKSLKLSHATA